MAGLVSRPWRGVLVATGHGRDGQTAFPAFRLAARAAVGLARTGFGEAFVAIVLAALNLLNAPALARSIVNF